MHVTVVPHEISVPVGNDSLELRVKHAGEGSPIVFLGSFTGHGGWEPFLDDLAGKAAVYAIELPGMSPDDRLAIHKVDTYWDLLLLVEEAIDGLELERPALVGHSFGAMLAADLAAHFPQRFTKLVLAAPLGLWSDECPVRTTELIAAAPEAVPGLLFHDVSAPNVTAALALPQDADEAVTAIAAKVWAMACVAKFIWPIPDNGLAKRLHRVRADTLVMFGEEDRIVPVSYAELFGDALPSARIERLAGCGHVPQVERPDLVGSLLDTFFGFEVSR